MTTGANVAVEAAFAKGATKVIVADAHGDMLNILPDELHQEVLLVRGTPRPLTMMEGLDEGFDTAFLVGYHAMSGTDRGSWHTPTPGRRTPSASMALPSASRVSTPRSPAT